MKLILSLGTLSLLFSGCKLYHYRLEKYLIQLHGVHELEHCQCLGNFLSFVDHLDISELHSAALGQKEAVLTFDTGTTFIGTRAEKVQTITRTSIATMENEVANSKEGQTGPPFDKGPPSRRQHDYFFRVLALDSFAFLQLEDIWISLSIKLLERAKSQVRVIYFLSMTQAPQEQQKTRVSQRIQVDSSLSTVVLPCSQQYSLYHGPVIASEMHYMSNTKKDRADTTLDVFISHLDGGYHYNQQATYLKSKQSCCKLEACTPYFFFLLDQEGTNKVTLLHFECFVVVFVEELTFNVPLGGSVVSWQGSAVWYFLARNQFYAPMIILACGNLDSPLMHGASILNSSLTSFSQVLQRLIIILII
ncbi:UNKNOWN [Stylonychia lemnae]|uniref:Uncharacterized protein n=1 Tax=Stylonychia lemnae TaxID=5949 RepID=A0A078B7S1_STYLE|nr:UNKNOWN [Stylonychia lemnae]|eukprot:CDW90429.1 UNKNOWN [Stylonychia lemnae]